jgi:curved DNA-binding protein CbpA
VTFPEIKARYKQLAKRLHPDANGGDTRAEEQLKKVNEAYATLKKSFVQ